MSITKQLLESLAISSDEYQAILELLGRVPNELELGLFGSLWSEHCGYKHSKPLLKLLPKDSSRTLVSSGEENAGAVDIGDGLAIVFKIESHNHPSAIEPYQGAATGIGGIVRDIFAMGARPIALLNSLRFGPLTNSHNKYIFNGVVAGISGYGNCLGIPNVGGEISFSESYTGNPLVNAMCVGLVESDKIVKSTIGGSGNLLVLVGAETGRDGIHGASGLASKSFEDDRELRPTVQVGNPFLEKILIEACLEIVATDHVAGLQDLGAAGLTSASVEAAANGNGGIIIDVSKVPKRENGMSAYDVMLSESQERMLVIVKKDRMDQVNEIFGKWGLSTTVIGTSTSDGYAQLFEGDSLQAKIPVEILTDPPQYIPDSKVPKNLLSVQSYDLTKLPVNNLNPEEILLKVLKSPNISSKESVFQQYDHQVQTNTITGPGSDAAVLRIKGTSKGIALSTDGNGRYCSLDPLTGGMIAVAEACRNVSVVGGTPIALTDCLNFGNPEKPEIYYQMQNCIKGMILAANTLGVPFVSGNVSLYNETRGESIYPTPIIGALGLLENFNHSVTGSFKNPGDIVVLIGRNQIIGELSSLGGSEYLEAIHGLNVGKPSIDLDLEKKVQKVCVQLIQSNLLSSAHDCSDGGLAITLAESCISGNVGFQSTTNIIGSWEAALFGEYQSSVVVSLPPKKLEQLENICRQKNVPLTNIGILGGYTFNIKPYFDIEIADMKSAWDMGLINALSSK